MKIDRLGMTDRNDLLTVICVAVKINTLTESDA